MTWNDLIKATAERNGQSIAATKQALNTAMDIVADQLAEGERVSLRHVGSLERKWSRGRVVRAVGNRRRMWVGGRFSVRFRPSKALREHLNTGDEADAWRSEEYQRAWRLAETLIDDLDLYHRAMVPADLSTDLTPAEVQSRCANAFGAHWEQVMHTWTQRGGPNTQTPFLGIAAQRRWA